MIDIGENSAWHDGLSFRNCAFEELRFESAVARDGVADNTGVGVQVGGAVRFYLNDFTGELGDVDTIRCGSGKMGIS